MLLKLMFVIFMRINFICNCEEPPSDVTDTSYVSGEYRNIFKSIPVLFEYVLDIIEQRPEILEKDDVTVFNEHPHDMFDEIAIDDDGTQNLHSGMNDERSIQFNLVWDRYPGVVERKRFDLSSTEVAQKTLEVERQLEEYNDNRSRN